MPLTIGWSDIAIRLALTLFAGAVIGFNRGARHRPAGLRTTMLICLAASLAMIEVNVLLSTAGKPATSFITLDPMRLPLGILSGIGFIGAGAIIRRGNVVEGITTAAALWYATVMGICFGGGQIALGLAALALAAFVLWCLKWVERLIGIPRRATLVVAFDGGSAVEQPLESALARDGYEVAAVSRCFLEDGNCREIRYELRWHEYGRARANFGLTNEFARQSAVHRLEWRQPAVD